MSTSLKTLLTFINKVVISALAFVNSAFAARYLNKVDRGEFQLSGTISQTGVTFVGGYTGYHSYALSKRPDDAEVIITMGNLFVFGAAAITWCVAFALQRVVFQFIPSYWWWAVLCMPLTFVSNYGTKLLQGANEITWLNRANLLQPVLFFLEFLVMKFGFHVPQHERLVYIYNVWLISFAGSAFLSVLIAFRRIHGKGLLKFRFSKPEWNQTMDYGGWLSVSNVANYVNYRMDLWWIYFFLPEKMGSEYGIAVTASEVLVNISTSVAQVVFTRMTGGHRQDAIQITESASRHTLISSTIVAIGMYIFFPWLIVTAFSNKYEASILPFMVLLPGLIVKAASNMIIQYATNQLGNPKTSIWMNGLSALINAICCILVIPLFGLVGGAIASTVSYVASFIVYIVWFSRVNNVPAKNLYAIRKDDIIPYIQFAKLAVRRLARR